MDPRLSEQIAYHRAVAAEYLDHAIDETGVRFIEADQLNDGSAFYRGNGSVSSQETHRYEADTGPR